MRYSLILLVLAMAWIPAAGLGPTVAPAAAPVPAEVADLAVARDASGQMWAAWQSDDGSDSEIMTSRRAAGGWSEPQPAQVRPQAWDRFPSLAIDANGTPWLAWASALHTRPDRRELLASRWTDGQWSGPQRVPLGDAVSAASPSMAAAPDGTLWLAWSGSGGSETDIYASHWDGRAWSEPWRVSGESPRDDFQPHLIVASDGRPWLVWVGHLGGPDDEIYASRWTGAGWTAEQMVNRDDDTLDSRPSVALGPDGQPWVAWKGCIAGGGRSQRRILFARWDASHLAWTPEQLASSPLALPVDEEDPALAVDGRGQMHLAWIAAANGATALAHALWTSAGRTEAQVVRSGVAADVLAAELSDGQAAILWLDPSVSPAPIAQATVEAAARPLATWVDSQAAPAAVLADPVPNRYLAFGDSITWGEYNDHAWTSYPEALDFTLDSRVRPSEVINSGEPSERTSTGRYRIAEAVQASKPKYVLIMEGTNDVSTHRDPGEVYTYYDDMIYNARHAGVDDIRLMLATLIPRIDDYNDETQDMNANAVIPIANDKNIPLCDQYGAFEDYGSYAELFWDDVHPNGDGLQLMADTWYDCILRVFTAIYEDTVPPSASLNPVPPQAPCQGTVDLSWSGSDNADGTGVANYDVQARLDSGGWVDWLVAYPGTSATFSGLVYGHRYYFHARARDRIGNVSAWTTEQWTDVVDTSPPYEVHVNPLNAVNFSPFTLSWGGSDQCSGVASYNVQFRMDGSPTWLSWKTDTAATSAPSDPAWPCGHSYSFRAQACDHAGLCGTWSTQSVFTVLACYGLSGEVSTVREQPVASAGVALNPGALEIDPRPGGFLAYLLTGGNYDITVSRAGFGPLAPMYDVPVGGNVSGLEFYLPPLDNAVTDGGFDSGSLAAWQVTGAVTLDNVAHTGTRSAQLDGAAEAAVLSQAMEPAGSIVNPTLSFLVRPDAAGPSTLTVELERSGAAPVDYTIAVAGNAWAHEWLDLEGVIGSPLTVTLIVSGSPAILVDEISLGSAIVGGYRAYLPVAARIY